MFGTSRRPAIYRIRQVKTTPEVRGVIYVLVHIAGICLEFFRRVTNIKIIIFIYPELLLRRTRSNSPQSCQGHHHLKLLLLLRARTSTEICYELLRVAVLLLQYFLVYGLHCCTIRSDGVSRTKTANMGDSNVTPNVTGNLVNFMRILAAMEDQSRSTDDAENAAAPCLQRTTTSGENYGEGAVIKFNYDFDGGFSSKSA